jgi:hypothetical protein
MSIRNLLRLLLPFTVALVVDLPISARAASDAAMLQSYAGNYLGTGALSGANTGKVRCRISFQPATAGSVNYIGRCSADGADMALTGVLTSRNGHIEAAMSGSGGLSAVVTGVRRGDGVVFKSKQHVVDNRTDRTITSTMALTGGTIEVDFSMLDNKTGKATTGAIPFVKLTR